MPRKNPAAVALGRRGGKANTPAQNAARRANGKKLLPRMLPCIHCGIRTTDRDKSRRPAHGTCPHAALAVER